MKLTGKAFEVLLVLIEQRHRSLEVNSHPASVFAIDLRHDGQMIGRETRRLRRVGIVSP